MTAPLLTTKLYVPPVWPNPVTGPVVDQAALLGLPIKVRDFGMPLLSVICVNPGRAYASDVK